MPSSKKNRITLEFPAEIAQLTKEEAASLRKIFRTQMANVLSDKVPADLLSIVITNPLSGGGESAAASSASKKTTKKAGRGATKKSSKKG
jgi:translation initiation factor 2B subunit (eIF-2B alpha/beta/delta family)